jgi:1-acyl-sn-glycerol-3-phosphate acyltransferase
VPTQRTIHDVGWMVTLVRAVAGFVLRRRGWRIEGHPPPDPRFVMIAAPHTSVWDVPLMLACVLQFRLRVHWIGLAAYFRWPVAGLLRWLGGVPITRGPAEERVKHAAALLASEDAMVVAIAPEGSRHEVPRWRTGFYHLATAAGVPLVMTALDHGRRTAVIGPAMMPTGDLEGDLVPIRTFYAGVQGRHPARQGPITVGDRPAPVPAGRDGQVPSVTAP